MQLELTAPARLFLAKDSIAAGDGARNVARSIARYVATPLSAAILRGEIRTGQTAKVAFDGKEITVNAA
jgi:ATP-dependent Clp protease ATP-binding subunit ClpA